MVSELECTSSTEFVKTYYANYEFKEVVTSPDYPKGCYVYVSGDRFEGYFNKHSTGTGHLSARAICKIDNGR